VKVEDKFEDTMGKLAGAITIYLETEQNITSLFRLTRELCEYHRHEQALQGMITHERTHVKKFRSIHECHHPQSLFQKINEGACNWRICPIINDAVVKEQEARGGDTD
jgi:predicted SprT family Zn-dependent metalloprotease